MANTIRDDIREFGIECSQIDPEDLEFGGSTITEIIDEKLDDLMELLQKRFE